MAPFWSRRDSGSDEDPLDMSLPPVSLGKFLPPRSSSSSSLGTMRKTTSMLEMNVIHDMVQFGEAMDALSPLSDEEQRGNSSNKQDQGDDGGDDGGFFIGSSDHDLPAEEKGAGAGQFLGLGLSSSPDSVIDIPQAPAAPPTQPLGGGRGGGGGMRRSMSQMTLTSAQRHHLSPLDIHTISEEPDSNPGEEGANTNFQDDKKKDDLAESNHSIYSVDSIGLDASQGRQRRPSRRSSARSNGMPKRSALKNSSNNLRSSLKSTNSTDSNTTIENDTNSRSNSMKRNVSFSSLEIRSYNVTLGDAPTTNGPPVSLDWEHDPEATAEYDLDSYETYRTDEAPRRNRHEMLMPASHRQYLLMREAGFTRGELMGAMEEAKRVAKQREKTIKRVQMGLQPVDEVLEKTRRKFGRLTGGGGSGKSGSGRSPSRGRK